MKLTFSREASGRDAADLYVRGVFETKGEIERTIKAHGKALGEHLAEHIKDEGFAGKAGEKLVIHTHGKMPAKKLALLGLGAEEGFGLERLRRAAGTAYRMAKGAKAKRVAVALPFGLVGKDGEGLQALCEGFLLAAYDFSRYKKPKEKETGVEEVIISVRDAIRPAVIQEAERRARVFADATNFARELVNTPSKDLTPKHLVEEAEKLVAEGRRLKLEVFGKKDLEKMGCGGILAVAQGSTLDPYMIHVTYRPPKKAKKRVALVGKGVTFDSGGLSLKPSDGMMDMKIDMGGAAAVMAAMRALPELLPDVEVHGIAAFVENMPSGTAIRPGDIVTTMSGKTIEILNTDAEGRVTLADTLHYATTLKPDVMIDMATLTGAIMVALGHDVAGLFGTDRKTLDRLKAASEATGEQAWEMPMPDDYADVPKSRNADTKNISGLRYGGAINAAIFLKEFIGTTPWAHIDMAGPAYNEKDYPDYRNWGASGYGARLFLQYLTSL